LARVHDGAERMARLIAIVSLAETTSLYFAAMMLDAF